MKRGSPSWALRAEHEAEVQGTRTRLDDLDRVLVFESKFVEERAETTAGPSTSSAAADSAQDDSFVVVLAFDSRRWFPVSPTASPDNQEVESEKDYDDGSFGRIDAGCGI